MKTDDCLTRLIREEGFTFRPLTITGIHNRPVLANNRPEMADEETSLFHGSVPDGDVYLDRLHRFVTDRLADRAPAPVVRFADGEYAFYDFNLHCNGLYHQAESVAAIRGALPLHVAALRRLGEDGLIAPLVFPGNTRSVGRLRALFRRPDGRDAARRFLDFLARSGVPLTPRNYIPFYAVYAYLTSPLFSRLVDGRCLCIVNSDADPEACRDWFTRQGSRPYLRFVQIPPSYLATRWAQVRDDILSRIPREVEICLAGAGVGALPLCVDAAALLGIPVIDAGHVVNLMNGLEAKSAGPRLYTFWRADSPNISQMRR